MRFHISVFAMALLVSTQAAAAEQSTCETIADLQTCREVTTKYKALDRWAVCDSGWYALFYAIRGAYVAHWFDLHQNKGVPPVPSQTAMGAELLAVCDKNSGDFNAFGAAVLTGMRLANRDR